MTHAPRSPSRRALTAAALLAVPMLGAVGCTGNTKGSPPPGPTNRIETDTGTQVIEGKDARDDTYPQSDRTTTGGPSGMAAPIGADLALASPASGVKTGVKSGVESSAVSGDRLPLLRVRETAEDRRSSVPRRAVAPAGASPTSGDAARAANPARGAVPAADADADMASAGYALLCQSFTGPQHLAQANDAKRQLAGVDGLTDWHAVHTADRSDLYYGHYRAVDDPSNPVETRRAAADRAAVRSLMLPRGGQPFGRAAFVSLDADDPSAPPEWDLANARGAFTLEIAAYTGPAEARKRAAVESVREARAGGVDAYYYHGPSASSVSVGTFPESAVTGFVNPTFRADTDGFSRTQPPGPNDAASLDAHETLIVSSGPLPDSVKRAAVDENGRPMKVVEPDVRYGPAVLAQMRQYPQYYINGRAVGSERVDPATGVKAVYPRASMVVRIPQDEGSALADGPAPRLGDEPRRDAAATPRVVNGRIVAGDASDAADAGATPAAVPDLLGGGTSRQGGRLKSYGR